MERIEVGRTRSGRRVWLIAGGGASRTEQVAWRARKDNVALNSTTWDDPNQPTSTNLAQDTDWTQPVDTNFRLRLEVEEDGGKNEVVAGTIEYNWSGSPGWGNTISTTSSVVKAVASGQFADGTATTNLLTGSGGTFVAGEGTHDAVPSNVALNSTHTEFCYVLQVVGADVSNGQTIDIRLTGIDVWTMVPTITVSKTTVVERSAAILATATIASAQTHTHIIERTAAVLATATIASAQERDVQRTAAVTATATIASSGIKVVPEYERSASLDAQATIASVAESFSVLERTATLDAEATIAAAGERISRFKVRNLVATAVAVDQIDLSWDDVTALTGETYDIERDGAVIVFDYAGTHTPGSPYEDTGLDAETEYTYRVAAVGGTEI